LGVAGTVDLRILEFYLVKFRPAKCLLSNAHAAQSATCNPSCCFVVSNSRDTHRTSPFCAFDRFARERCKCHNWLCHWAQKKCKPRTCRRQVRPRWTPFSKYLLGARHLAIEIQLIANSRGFATRTGCIAPRCLGPCLHQRVCWFGNADKGRNATGGSPTAKHALANLGGVCARAIDFGLA